MRRTSVAQLILFISAMAMVSISWVTFAGKEIEQTVDFATSMLPEMANWNGPEDDAISEAFHRKIDPRLIAPNPVPTEDHSDSSSDCPAAISNAIEEMVHIQIITHPHDLNFVKSTLISLGGRITRVGTAGFGEDCLDSDLRIIQGWSPISVLEKLASNDAVLYVRAPLKPPKIQEPADAPLPKAFDLEAWHASGFRGGGVKVGIVDIGFAGTSENEFDDLDVIEARNFVDDKSIDSQESDSSQEMESLRIIHEIAPDAELYFVAVETLVDFQEAVSWLIDDIGVDIVQTNIVGFSCLDGSSPTIFTNTSDPYIHGKTYWATPAGWTWEKQRFGPFNDGGDGFHLFSPKRNVEPVDWTDENGDITFKLPVHTFIFWEEPSGLKTDLDLFLLRWDGLNWQPVAESRRTLPEKSSRLPFEYLETEITDSTTMHGYAVRGKNVKEDLYFDTLALKGDNTLENTADSTMTSVTSSQKAGIAALIKSARPRLYPDAIYASVKESAANPDAFFADLSETSDTLFHYKSEDDPDCPIHFEHDFAVTYYAQNDWQELVTASPWEATSNLSIKRLRVKTTNATSDIRIRILVNGGEIDSWTVGEAGPDDHENNIAVDLSSGDIVTYEFKNGDVENGTIASPVDVFFCNTQNPTSGSLRVTIAPQEAIDAGAKWRVDGGTWQNSGATVADLSIGNHTVCYNTVSGWDSPGDDTVAIGEGATTETTGTYIQQTGSLQAAIAPQDAVDAGAQWNVDGGIWRDSGDTATGLSAGNHLVSFSEIDGWNSPADRSVDIVKGALTNVSGTYTTGWIQVTLSPQSAVDAGAMWSVDGGTTWNASGATVGGFDPGDYTITFENIPDWTTPNEKTVSVRTGVTAEAKGHYVDQFFTEIQSLQETNENNKIADIESFEINGETYLAVIRNYDGSSHNVNSFIYKWTGEAFEKIQDIPTHSSIDCEVFVINDVVYLAIANSNDETSFNIDSVIYRWNGAYFIEFQSIPTNSAHDWESFVIGNNIYLGVTNVCDSSTMPCPDWAVDSKIYKWTGSSFDEVQSILTYGAVEMESFGIDDETYMAMANNYIDEHGTLYDIDSKIYKWDGEGFEEIQSIPTNGANDWEHFEIDGETYLAVANSINGDESVDIDSRIYKWNGSSFQPFQSIRTSCGLGFTHFKANEEHYLFAANMHDGSSQSINSKLYRWNGAAFVEVENIATHGAKGGEAFRIAGKIYLAVPHYENGYSSIILEATGIMEESWFVEEEGACGGKEPCYAKAHKAMEDADSGATVMLGEGILYENVTIGEGMKVEIGWDCDFSTMDQIDPVIIRGPLPYQYTVTEITGSIDGKARAINDNRIVVGAMYSTMENNYGFTWQNGELSILEDYDCSRNPYSEGEPNGINHKNIIAGSALKTLSDGCVKYPVYWEDTAKTELLFSGTWIGDSEVRKINDLGWIVGRVHTGKIHACMWDENGDYIDLGYPLPPDPWDGANESSGIDISYSGKVIGFTRKATRERAYSWLRHPDGSYEDIFGPEGADFYVCAMNDLDQIVGNLREGFDVFIWDDGVLTNLGHPGNLYTTPRDMNNAGVIVGHYTLDSGPQSGVIYKDGQWNDLNDLIPADSGWFINEAFGINEHGDIVGQGELNGEKKAFILTPVE